MISTLVDAAPAFLATSEEVSTGASVSVFWIVACSVAAPLLARLTRGYVPAIVS